MIGSQKIKEVIKIMDFVDKIKNHSRENVICTKHTFFRLSEKQREIFTCETIKHYMFEETPVFVGIQYNGNFAVFYKYPKQMYLRLIIDIKPDKIDVVTFYIIEKTQLPVIK
ncbi:MAG: hypothetical protein ISS93_02525 [Candidatus Aenigmarchaeota archaeon]|nr:hypothetical protein [Candidatus Aenigmarchaeota archaeon]